jgi:uncharacterized protein YdeI (YjbR/CyaY-like superfamily)
MSAKQVELPIFTPKTHKEFERWLGVHHQKSPGVWVRFFKKDSGKKDFTYAEALDVALCFGWIDSQLKTYDKESYIQKFTPRGPKSVWSKRNKEHVARLIEEKRMKPAGLAQVKAAQRDGRWEGAYDSPKNMQAPADFMRELKKNKNAHAFYKTLNRANQYAIGWRLQTAKKLETRQKRMRAILAMLAKGQKFHD